MGLGTAVPAALLIVAFCRPVVYIVYSACSLVMYGKRCMTRFSEDALCGPAIDVPDKLPYVAVGVPRMTETVGLLMEFDGAVTQDHLARPH